MLPQLLRRLTRYLPLIVLLAASGGATAYLTAKSQVTYKAQSQFRLVANDPIAELLSTTATAPRSGASDTFTQTETAVLLSEPVMRRLSERVGLSRSSTRKALSVAGDSTTQTVRVVATRDTRTQATDLANGLLPAYVDYRNKLRQEQIDESVAALGKQSDALLRRATSLRRQQDAARNESTRNRLRIRLESVTDRYDSVFARRQELLARAAVPAQSATLIRRASADDATPSSTRRLGILGAFLGGLIGLVFALVREQYRDVVSDDDDVRTTSGLPAVGRVPRLRRGLRRDRLPVLKRPAGPLAEALRTLRVNLRRYGTDLPEVLVVTSTSRGDGKTFVATNLAAVAAQGGIRTVLVSADLRDPSADGVLGVTTTDGGLAKLLDVGRETPATAEEIRESLRPTSVPHLLALPAGRPGANPADLLAHDSLPRLLAALREEFELIVVDTPPVLAVSDALLLAEHADATLLVATVDRTRRGELRRAADLLREGLSSPVYGVVNRATESSGRAYPTPSTPAAPRLTGATSD